MKKATLLLVLVMVVGLAGGCAEDVILPPLPTLLGVYVGEYHVKDGDSPTETRKITWSFSDEVYHMTVDTGQEAGFCSPSGQYLLGDRVIFEESNAGCSGGVFNEGYNPSGGFDLFQPGDSVILKQNMDGMEKVIQLVPKP